MPEWEGTGSLGITIIKAVKREEQYQKEVDKFNKMLLRKDLDPDRSMELRLLFEPGYMHRLAEKNKRYMHERKKFEARMKSMGLMR